MSDKYNGFRVVGPNTTDYRESMWYFPNLEEAKTFCEAIAEYDILQYIGTARRQPPAWS